MSAILAIWNRDGRPIDPAIIDTMLTASSHRAVDGQNVYIDGCVALAHQHFWLTPEEQGEVQPIIDKDASLVMTCDARLDDRDTLQKKLAINKSQKLSDAQLILRAFKRWGEACVDHLLGDFAFAILQPKEEKMFVARDALGARDLCYFESNEAIVVASEICSILEHPSVPRRINETKIGDYLLDYWDEQENSFYENVFYWPPGHCGIVSDRHRNMRCYWYLDTGRRIHHANEKDYALEFRETLQNSIKNRLRIHGNVAVSLSGGPDSASVAALIAQNSKDRGPVCISYVFDNNPDCDERRFIQPVTDRLNLDSVLIKGDSLWPLSDLPTWPVFRDFPGQDAYIRMPMAVIEKAAINDCRVVFTGHFSDVLLVGGKYWAIDLLSHGQVFKFAKALSQAGVAGDEIRRLFRLALSAWVPYGIKSLRRNGVAAGLSENLNALSAGFIERARLREALSERADRGYGIKRFQRQRAAQLTSAIEPQGTSAFRRLSNSKHVEYIDPFWDRRLIEYAVAIPAHILGYPPYPKRLLRIAMEGAIPDSVVWRRGKTSLVSLFQAGLAGFERKELCRLLTDSEVVKRGYIDSNWLATEMGMLGNSSNQGSCSYALWAVLCLELWLRRFWRD